MRRGERSGPRACAALIAGLQQPSACRAGSLGGRYLHVVVDVEALRERGHLGDARGEPEDERLWQGEEARLGGSRDSAWVGDRQGVAVHACYSSRVSSLPPPLPYCCPYPCPYCTLALACARSRPGAPDQNKSCLGCAKGPRDTKPKSQGGLVRGATVARACASLIGFKPLTCTPQLPARKDLTWAKRNGASTVEICFCPLEICAGSPRGSVAAWSRRLSRLCEAWV